MINDGNKRLTLKEAANKIKAKILNISEDELKTHRSNGDLPVLSLIDRYIADRDMSEVFAKAVHERFVKEAKKGEKALHYLTTRSTAEFYANYKSKNTPSDIVAKEFFTVANKNYPLVKQAIDTLKRIQKVYFPENESFNDAMTLKILDESALKDPDMYVVTDEKYKKYEMRTIREKIFEILKNVTSPAAVVYAIDAIKKPESGDGFPYYADAERKVGYTITEMVEEKIKIPKESINTLCKGHATDMLKYFLQANFHAREIKEFINTGKISDREKYLYSGKQKVADDRVRGITFYRIRNMVENLGSDAAKEVAEKYFNVVNRQVQTKRVLSIIDVRKGYGTQFTWAIKDAIEQKEKETPPNTIFIKAANEALEMIQSVERQTLLYEITMSDIGTLQNPDKRNAVIMECKDYQVEQNIKKDLDKDEVAKEIAKEAGDLFSFVAEVDRISDMNSENVEDHLKHIVNSAKERKKRIMFSNDNEFSYKIPQSEMTDVFNKNLDKLVSFKGIIIRELADGSKEGSLEEVKMLPVEAFKQKIKEGLPFEPPYDFLESDNKIALGKKGAFLSAKFNDRGKAIEGTIAVHNIVGGKMPLGMVMTPDGERAMSKYWGKGSPADSSKSKKLA